MFKQDMSGEMVIPADEPLEQSPTSNCWVSTEVVRRSVASKRESHAATIIFSKEAGDVVTGTGGPCDTLEGLVS